ncbi:MAG: alpha/beta hydrolase, partial [Geminicoccaceae bacterium]
TTNWLNATFRSIDLTWAGGYAEAIATPVLMIGGEDDTTVVNARLEQMAERLPKGEFRLIERAGHELLVECDDIYRRFFEEFRGWANVDIKTPPIDMAGCIRSE